MVEVGNAFDRNDDDDDNDLNEKLILLTNNKTYPNLFKISKRNENSEHSFDF